MKILVADDDFAMRSLLTDELQDEGYLVCQVDNGHEALDCLQRFRPDLIITDLRVPDGGMQLVARLQAAKQDTPIILMTAFGNADTEAQARRNGAAAYFSKPFRMEELKTAIRRLLARNQI
jgi:two-component system response regulator (stage 0 sporulation protein F)